MKIAYYFLFIFLCASCFPVAIAPKLDEGKLMRAKKFKRKMPNRYSYIFSDPKDADEFYYYVNTKYQRNHVFVSTNVPVLIKKDTFFLSFKETGKKTKIFNLWRPFTNEILEREGLPRVFNDDPLNSRDSWYILLMVMDTDLRDVLNPTHPQHEDILNYVSSMKKEYLSMSNYNQAMLPIRDYP